MITKVEKRKLNFTSFEELMQYKKGQKIGIAVFGLLFRNICRN